MRREYYIIEEVNIKALTNVINEMAQSGWRMEHFTAPFLGETYEPSTAYVAVMVKEEK